MRTKRVVSLLVAAVMIFTAFVLPVSADDTQGDVYEVISRGIGSAERYLSGELTALSQNGGVTYGCEWYIITLLRAGKDIDGGILDEYYQSLESTVCGWTGDTKPTDIERTALALAAMGYDITDIGGVDLASLICNSPRLSDGSNELAYALLAIDSVHADTPEDALWTRESIKESLLSFQSEDGGFGLYSADDADVDVTALCIQALAPYSEDGAVAAAIEDAVAFLQDGISDGYNYAGNSNTTAQVLLALATLGVDVTDESNGFGDGQTNIITALDAYRDADTGGYFYNSKVNTMATLQAMQAYDAYRKYHMEGICYWDFAEDGADYDDTASGGSAQPDDEAAPPAEVYVTIASGGDVVTHRDGGHMAQAPVTVLDIDADGMLTVDEALYAAHEAYYDGGAESGYASYVSPYGLSLAMLWGCGSIDAPTSAGYWRNNSSCWSLADEVEEGDYLTAFNYADTKTWSDAYAYFTQNEVSVTAGESVTLQLMSQSGYGGEDTGYAPIFSPCAGAKIMQAGKDEQDAVITDADGKAVLSVEDSKAGTYYYIASRDNGVIVPAVCKVTVQADDYDDSYDSGSRGGSGGAAVYTVRFDSLGGSAVAEQKANRNDTIVRPSDPVKDGFVFGGWYTDKECENVYDFDTGVIKNITLYAKWVDAKDAQSGNLDTSLVFDQNTFEDVTESSWYYEGVGFAYKNGLMKGTGSGFEPDGSMTRAMLITVLWRMDGEPSADGDISFGDVNQDSWYTDAVRWAAGEKIVSGMSEECFGTEYAITREQLATILYRYVQSRVADADINESADIDAYTDLADVSDYAKDAVRWAVGAGIINGNDAGAILPDACATRAQTATMLMRFVQVYGR